MVHVTEFADNDEKIKYLEKTIRELEHDLAYVQRSTKVELSSRRRDEENTSQEKDLELLELKSRIAFL